MTTLKEKTEQGFVFHRQGLQGFHEYKKDNKGFLYDSKCDKIVFEYEEEFMEASRW